MDTLDIFTIFETIVKGVKLVQKFYVMRDLSVGAVLESLEYVLDTRMESDKELKSLGHEFYRIDETIESDDVDFRCMASMD
ncbi:41279_t:CDS:2 [Gigaspora margarita]|uniref:41279_t:CDS:1 n=1 Tax=Gigaspora margarita TaxID=4874 RepID=A0ABM8VXK3_GIGMA|nr:41279_t:CDS:2 [Gigaspora margarita]